MSLMSKTNLLKVVFGLLSLLDIVVAFCQQQGNLVSYNTECSKSNDSVRLVATSLNDMKRPLFDQIAATLFDLEQKRVNDSSEIDEQGRTGEPMAWSEPDSLANKFSQIMSGGIGYQFKQFVADITAGEYDEAQTMTKVDTFVEGNKVTMFSFTTCPFCRRAKDFLDAEGIRYSVMELDELPGNEGNEIRAALGRKTQRTSVPSIFINGRCIGGCNDGPGLLPLASRGELSTLLNG